MWFRSRGFRIEPVLDARGKGPLGEMGDWSSGEAFSKVAGPRIYGMGTRGLGFS